MKKVTPKQSETFVHLMTKELIKLGATPFINESNIVDRLEFNLETKGGNLWLRVDTDNEWNYTLFGRFDDVERAKNNITRGLYCLNEYSGKWNHHLIPQNPQNAVYDLIEEIKQLL